MKDSKIIFAVTNDLTHDRRMYRICTALSGAGAKVTLAGRKLKGSKAFHPSSFDAVRLACWWNKGFLFYAEYNVRLFFFLLTSSYDVACACDLDTALAVRLASWLKRKKTVYDAHEFFTEVPEITHRPFLKAIWKTIANLTIPGFHSCYTVGEELASLMAKQYKRPFGVIRNIEPAVHHLEDPYPEHRKKILLYQGALNVGRGLEACVKAMVHLPDWQFWLAGEGDITNHLKALVDTLHLKDRVIFLGWVAPHDLPALMREARLAVNLREHDSLNDYYSLPNKFFDAIHAGLPSINMNYPEYARICATYPCAYLIDSLDEKIITNAILDLDAHQEKWKAMSDACLEASKEFTWEKESKKLLEIYQKLTL